MLVDAIDALSGGLHMLCNERILSGRTSKFIIIFPEWENIHIYKDAHHIMNFEAPPESSLITKYVYRPPDSTSIAPTNITT